MMNEQPRTDAERRLASQLRSELDAALRPFDPAVIVRQAEEQEPSRPVLRVALAGATIAAAVVITLAAIQLPTLAPSMGFGPEVTEEPSPSQHSTADPTPEPSPSPSLTGAPERALSPPDAGVLRELAARFMLDDPPQDAQFERYISPEEYAAVMVPCLTEQGIPAHPLPDGGVGYGDWPEEQWLLQAEAAYRCNVRFPIDPMFEEPLNENQLRRLYSYLVDELTPCLEDEGYATTTPPTVDVFIGSYPTGHAWSPLPANDPGLHDEEEWYRLNVACPQSPSLKYLYGDAVTP
jgi:hypothetical protein